MNWRDKKVRLRAPVCITWQITNQCNLRCIHCLSDSSKRKPDELTMDEIKKFLDDLAAMQVFYINVGGGEPLMHPNFYEIADYGNEKGIYIQFSTNGTLIDRHAAQMIAERNLRVQVSIDGWNQKINDQIRGVGTFDKAINAVRLLCEKNVVVSVNCVATRSNMEDLDNIYQLVKSVGAKLRLSRLRPSGRAIERWKELTPKQEQYVYLYKWLKDHPDVNTGDSFFFLSALGEPLPGLSYCGAWDLTCSVDEEGDIYPCPFTVTDSLLIGNIKEKPLSQWWQEIQEVTQITGKASPVCEACANYTKCHGGCRGASYLVYGDWSRPDPDCLRGVSLDQVGR